MKVTKNQLVKMAEAVLYYKERKRKSRYMPTQREKQRVQIMEILQIGLELNPECEVVLDNERTPNVSWDDVGDCIIYEVEK